MERAGGEGVDHAVGIVLGPPVVSVAHGLAQILRAALDSHRFGGGNDAQPGPVELHVRAHIAGLVRHRAVQVTIVFFIFKFQLDAGCGPDVDVSFRTNSNPSPVKAS